MSGKEKKAILSRCLDRWNRGDLEGYLELYDPKVVLHGYQGVEPGLAGVKQFYQALWEAFPGNQLTLEDVIIEEDKLACRFTITATHSGPFMGMPATGKEVEFGGITILLFRNGKCVERWSQTDFMRMLQQLGAIPAPGEGGS
ncbi:MAG TPA: ester cyclase [Gemmatimonadales bacterium]|jgi:steroid delta-isomerase-like uncharacterized protein|nr:ester cyclase [Gemmatimonadales bacterium]